MGPHLRSILQVLVHMLNVKECGAYVFPLCNICWVMICYLLFSQMAKT